MNFRKFFRRSLAQRTRRDGCHIVVSRSTYKRRNRRVVLRPIINITGVGRGMKNGRLSGDASIWPLKVLSGPHAPGASTRSEGVRIRLGKNEEAAGPRQS